MRKTTISLIKCDVGSLAGHYVVPEPLLNIAEKNLKKAKGDGLVNSYHILNVGDDLQLLMVQREANQIKKFTSLLGTRFRKPQKGVQN